MIFCRIFLNILFVSVGGWDHFYGTSLDIAQEIHFKPPTGGIWNILKPPSDQTAGASRPCLKWDDMLNPMDGKIRILKRKNKITKIW